MTSEVLEIDERRVEVVEMASEVAGLVCGLSTTDELGTTVSAAITRLVEGTAEDCATIVGTLIVLGVNAAGVELSVHGSVDVNVKVP